MTRPCVCLVVGGGRGLGLKRRRVEQHTEPRPMPYTQQPAAAATSGVAHIHRCRPQQAGTDRTALFHYVGTMCRWPCASKTPSAKAAQYRSRADARLLPQPTEKKAGRGGRPVAGAGASATSPAGVMVALSLLLPLLLPLLLRAGCQWPSVVPASSVAAAVAAAAAVASSCGVAAWRGPSGARASSTIDGAAIRRLALCGSDAWWRVPGCGGVCVSIYACVCDWGRADVVFLLNAACSRGFPGGAARRGVATGTSRAADRPTRARQAAKGLLGNIKCRRKVLK